MALYYLDTSAAFKLLAAEEHADAFLAFYREHRGDNWISSDLLRIEVSRAVARNWPALIPDAQRLLDAFEYVQIDDKGRIVTAISCMSECLHHFSHDGVTFSFHHRREDLPEWRAMQGRLIALHATFTTRLDTAER